jgi:DNA-binding IclR family transcriptional regulator
MAKVRKNERKAAKRENVFNGEVKDDYIVSSLVRGLRILSTFTIDRPSLKVSEIAEINGLDQATVFRFVYTLEKLGYLIRDEDTKRYRQGVRMLTISLPAREGIAVREIALPLMNELSKATEETIRISVLDGIDTVMIGVVEIPDRIYFRTRIGERLPTYGTALGKVLLAYQPMESWDKIISQFDFSQHTEKTLITPESLRDELLKVRQQGYSIQDGEIIEGLGSIAAPVFNFNNEIVAAIDLSGLSTQIFDKEKNGHFIDEVVKCARRISDRLGQVQ